MLYSRGAIVEGEVGDFVTAAALQCLGRGHSENAGTGEPQEGTTKMTDAVQPPSSSTTR